MKGCVEALSDFSYVVLAAVALFRLCVFRSVSVRFIMFFSKKIMCEFFKVSRHWPGCHTCVIDLAVIPVSFTWLSYLCHSPCLTYVIDLDVPVLHHTCVIHLALPMSLTSMYLYYSPGIVVNLLCKGVSVCRQCLFLSEILRYRAQTTPQHCLFTLINAKVNDKSWHMCSGTRVATD